jgi:hypothetical protein
MIKSVFMCVLGLVMAISNCSASREFMEFYKLPNDQQEEQFRKFPIQKQIDFHIQAMSLEPPEMKFAQLIANRGESVISPVLARLKTDRHDRRLLDYMLIFKDFCRERSCIRDYPKLIDELQTETPKIEDPFWREKAESDLEIIKGAPVPFPKVPSRQ